MHSEDVAHDDHAARTRDANCVRVAVGRSPLLRPHIPNSTLSGPFGKEEKEVAYDPAMFPSCENAFTSATATARFDGGRGKELLTQVYNTVKPAYDWAIRNLNDVIRSQDQTYAS